MDGDPGRVQDGRLQTIYENKGIRSWPQGINENGRKIINRRDVRRDPVVQMPPAIHCRCIKKDEMAGHSHL